MNQNHYVEQKCQIKKEHVLFDAIYMKSKDK